MKTHDIYIPAIKDTVTYTSGENSADNFKVIDAANADDYWFHVSEKSSSHVTVSPPEGINKKQLAKIITQGVVLCKQLSKYASEKDLPIIYTQIKNIQKTNIVGSVNVTGGKVVTC